MEKPRFGIGTKYSPIGKSYVCEIIDIWTTTNQSGEVVRIEYVSTHSFGKCDGIKRHDPETTVARGLLETAPDT